MWKVSDGSFFGVAARSLRIWKRCRKVPLRRLRRGRQDGPASALSGPRALDDLGEAQG